MQDNESIMNAANLKSLNKILLNVEKMDSLIKGILNYSSIESQMYEERSVDLNKVVRDCLKSMDLPKNTTVKILNELPTIKGDLFRLKQLFQNIIQNAIKYNDKEIKTVEIGFLENYVSQNGKIKEKNVLYVKDNGQGIDPEFYDEIFRIFKRLQSSKDKTDEGTGVGLTFVKKIVERHGGNIWLESELGKGTTFYFTIGEGNDLIEAKSSDSLNVTLSFPLPVSINMWTLIVDWVL